MPVYEHSYDMCNSRMCRFATGVNRSAMQLSIKNTSRAINELLYYSMCMASKGPVPSGTALDGSKVQGRVRTHLKSSSSSSAVIS